MFQYTKCSSRKLLLGCLVFALVFFVCWQLIGLSRQTNTVETATFVQSVTDATAQVRFSSCNRTNRVKNVTESIDAFQWCSADSSARGTHQKVITYTLFGAGKENDSVSNRYDSLLSNISITAKELYPGWIVRIYHNFRKESESERTVLHDLDCQFNHVDVCSVPEIIDNIPALTPIDPALLGGLNPRMLRFLVMLDPNVDIFISRDTDSVIWPREVDAVDEWLRSNYTFHLMRDHRKHNHLMLAGSYLH